MPRDWEGLRTPAAQLRRSWFESGFWNDDTFPAVTRQALERSATSTVVVRSAVRPYVGTVADVADEGRRLAGFLAARGIGPGDVVAFQLPNWMEAVACFWGLLELGAVLVPAVHIYGHKELRHILRQSRARAFITADRFGRQDFLANLEEIGADAPDLEVVVVVGNGAAPALPAATVPWADAVRAGAPVERLAVPDPDEPAVVGYTSGTTADPKGVVHTHRTLLAEIRQYGLFYAQLKPGVPGEVAGALSAAPVSHITGLLGVLGPLRTGGPLNLLDQWDPALVLRVMAEEQLSSGGGATFFLTSLLDHPDFDPEVHLPLMRRVSMGGSPIPAEVARRAASLGILLTRAYGSTEHPSTTMSLASDPEDKRLYTDGRAMPGVELRLVDDDGREVPTGTPGEILSRGPDLFVGYVDPRLTEATLDADGWYSTGDVGVLDVDGYLTITDRKKDIIIRGGENISAAEVEEILQRVPGVSEVAVVAAPDARYGEHGCAFVRVAPGTAAPDLDLLRGHLQDAGLARQKWPEELRLVDELPRTASGKVQKHVLRASLREEAGA